MIQKIMGREGETLMVGASSTRVCKPRGAMMSGRGVGGALSRESLIIGRNINLDKVAGLVLLKR